MGIYHFSTKLLLEWLFRTVEKQTLQPVVRGIEEFLLSTYNLLASCCKYFSLTLFDVNLHVQLHECGQRDFCTSRPFHSFAVKRPRCKMYVWKPEGFAHDLLYLIVKS